jgi:Urocanase Rossmann-like domain
MQSRDLQHETMRIYRTIVDIRDDWGGRLVLCCGSGCAQSGAPAAVSIAGGTLLAIDSDAAAMKSAMRAGYLDFVVNTLDEALRTLKNEIRQKRPLSVGLIADVETTLAEMVERGLQPDLQLVDAGCPDRSAPHLETLRARGMSCRSALASENEYFFPASDGAGLRTIDAALLAVFPAEDIVRRRWLDRVPKYLREARSGGRWTWLSKQELESLAEAGLSPGPQP